MVDIDRVVSKISEKYPELSHTERSQLTHLLRHIRKNGISLSSQLFNSRKTFSSNDSVLEEYVRRLNKKSLADVKGIISNYNDMVNRKTHESQSKINQRKESYFASLNEIIERKYEPGGPGSLAAQQSFNRAAKRQRDYENEEQPSKMTRFGGKRTKHKKHNTNKTIRRRQRKHK
jgi:hypothetical protein